MRHIRQFFPSHDPGGLFAPQSADYLSPHIYYVPHGSEYIDWLGPSPDVRSFWIKVGSKLAYMTHSRIDLMMRRIRLISFFFNVTPRTSALCTIDDGNVMCDISGHVINGFLSSRIVGFRNPAHLLRMQELGFPEVYHYVHETLLGLCVHAMKNGVPSKSNDPYLVHCAQSLLNDRDWETLALAS